MKMEGEYILPADRPTVWAALNNAEVLKACIPGCESFEQDGENGFKAVAVAKVGPVKARFKGDVTLTDLNPPESYRISGQGSGGVAGFAKGGAEVRLEEMPEGTRLTYDVDAQVGGKLAQVGQRLVQSSAKKMADQFFANFAAKLSGEVPQSAPIEA